MSGELGAFACHGCGGPLRFGLQGFRCLLAKGSAVHCGGQDEFRQAPTKKRARNVEKFECSGKCGWTVKLKLGEPRPESRYCECGGMLVFVALQSR